MTIFFTSDTHFGHTNIIRFCPETRPFTSVDEMDSELVRRWNSVVGERDTVYHLGDFTLFTKMTDADKYFSQLNGTIVFVRGNHDAWIGSKGIFPITKNSVVKFAGDMLKVKWEGERIILCHYPMRTWDGAETGSWHLFGHVHGAMPPHGKSFDVGVDANNLYPVSFEDVRKIMGTL
jgi:calcineurin-like phosphoesterase family protein